MNTTISQPVQSGVSTGIDKSIVSVDGYIRVKPSQKLSGEMYLNGAKNAVLPIMASLILTDGVSTLSNVPASKDVLQMITLLETFGATIDFDQKKHILHVDTRNLEGYTVTPTMMKTMRASVLVIGPLLARFGRAEVGFPGGDAIGARPIDYHLTNFERLGATCTIAGEFVSVCSKGLHANKLVLPYPSHCATENLIMASVCAQGTTKIVNASLEPEVTDLIGILKKMGACIEIKIPSTIEIQGVQALKPVDHEVLYDRLEAGSLILAAAITGGELYLPQASSDLMDVFLLKMQEMGHTIESGPNDKGIIFRATENPQAISLRTAAYPGFPTDLQAPMMAALSLAEGTSSIYETVWDNRFSHARELKKMGAKIRIENDRVYITGVSQLKGADLFANDIRASFALVMAGLVASGETSVYGLHHWLRGYDAMDAKLTELGAAISLVYENQ